MTSSEVSIRAASDLDAERIWQTLEPTIRAGEALALASDSSREGRAPLLVQRGQ